MLNNHVKNDSFWMTLASKVLLNTAVNDTGESNMRTTDMVKVRLECFKFIVRFTHDCCALLSENVRPR